MLRGYYSQKYVDTFGSYIVRDSIVDGKVVGSVNCTHVGESSEGLYWEDLKDVGLVGDDFTRVVVDPFLHYMHNWNRSFND